MLAEAFPWLQPLRALRILRVLRPLRLIARSPGMKIIIRSLATALPEVREVVGVIFVIQARRYTHTA